MTECDTANVLLVDDQPSRLLTYEAILEPLRQNLVKVRSGAAALQSLLDMEFAAILLDVSMPGMNGFETADLIRQHPRFQQMPIIFVTGVHVTDMDRLRGYRMGAVDYVHVPVVPEILRGKLQVLVQLHQQRCELRRLNRSLAAANSALAQAHSDLRAEKTRELEQANQALRSEIRERERAQQALHQAARRKDEFLAILAHELRNPLSAIHNGVQVLRSDRAADARTSRIHALLERQVTHLTRLIEDLLDVSRITSGRIRLKREPVELGTIIARALETARPLLEERKHQLTVATPGRPVYVEGDSVRLVQMIDNLLTNACKYTNDGGAIAVTLAADGPGPAQALIRVRDNGVGIPPEMLEQVFDLFAQASAPLNRPQGGLGIGLSLVRGLAELHGGSVHADSAGVGRGAEFVVRLPCCPAPEAGAMPGHAPAPPRERPLRVLIVDDNIDSADGLAMRLSDLGHDVAVAYTGEDGVLAAREQPPDAVLLDIALPGIDGYEVARRLRASEQTGASVIIAMTGFGGRANREQALAGGFDHYLVKPLSHEALMRLLAQCSESKRLPGAVVRAASPEAPDRRPS